MAPPSDKAGVPPAAFACLGRLTRRAEFLAAARAARASAPGLNLQGRNRGDDRPPRYGVTATKKVGNAVARNRAKRRLRALADELLPRIGRQGWDYVLVARPDVTADRPWPDLLADLERALLRVHMGRKPSKDRP